MKGWMLNMKQYCRYCAFCCENECYYCTNYQKVMSESQIKRPNTCKEFAQTEDIITGKEYKPREQTIKRTKRNQNCVSVSLFLDV